MTKHPDLRPSRKTPRSIPTRWQRFLKNRRQRRRSLATKPIAAESLGDYPSRVRYAALRQILQDAVDKLIAFLVLVLSFPFLCSIALLIRLDSPGPAIFTQQRIARIPPRRVRRGLSDTSLGSSLVRNEDPPTFTIYKFRTYHVNTDHLVRERARFDFPPEEIETVSLQLQDDPRVTRVGRFLRRTSLDELPNFVNVLLGQMSVVGPRPEVAAMYRYYTEEQKSKFSVKPGITGWAQVNGRGRLNFKQTVDYDLWYVRNKSWWLDLKILLRTIRVVLNQDGAY